MVVYLILFLGLLNWMSFMSSRVLMSLFAIELGASAAAIGVLIALYGLGPLLLSVHAGRVSDRLGSYWPIVLGAAGLAVGLAIPYFLPQLPALYLAALVNGLSFVFINIAMQNLVTSFGDAEARTRNVSLQSLAIALAALIGPLLVGISIDQRGHVPTFLYLALVVAASCAGWIACRRVIPHSGGRHAPGPGGGVRDMLAQPALRRIIIVSGLVVAGVDLYTFYMPIYGHSIGLSATMIGVVLGAHAAATFVVRTVLPQLVRRWGEERVMTYSMYLAGVTFLLFPFVQHVAALLLLSFVLGLGLGVGQPLSVITTYNRAPQGRTGEALGLRFSVVNMTHMAVPLAFGTLGSALGLVTVFLSNAALMFGGGYANARGASWRTKE
ncbi:MAG: MFS transporter [Betaproteobacteria bacterium]|nr:MFS transporter [Betaproteobacteria bacterium]